MEPDFWSIVAFTVDVESAVVLPEVSTLNCAVGHEVLVTTYWGRFGTELVGE